MLMAHAVTSPGEALLPSLSQPSAWRQRGFPQKQNSPPQDKGACSQSLHLQPQPNHCCLSSRKTLQPSPTLQSHRYPSIGIAKYCYHQPTELL